jgi:ADP-ribose pyrophosphatase YjhB (NUDIX family)
MHKPNFVIEANDGNQYWISRSIAVVAIPLFHCNGLTYVPLGRRSSTMNLYPNFFGIPCGFLDWGESASEAVEREVFEELGIKLSDYCFGVNPQPDAVISDPNPAENETVSLRFVVHCTVDALPNLKPDTTETTEAVWMQVSGFDLSWKSACLAFNHTEIIHWALNMSINALNPPQPIKQKPNK